jgi:cation:H+ antiporter
VNIALLARLSTAVVALTVVAMGTSLPELAVSLDAAARHSTDIAFGNIIGSCVFNIGAILGVAAVISTIPVRRETIRFEYPVMLFVALLTVIVARDGMVDRLDGITLVVGLVIFIGTMIVFAKRGVSLGEAEALKRDVERAARLEEGPVRAWGRNVLYVIGGIVALVAGAEFSVNGGVAIARDLGVEERVIGLTVIAMGTSLPELATSVVATVRRESEIALGNVVGSNIFNILAILGITATIFPVPVNAQAIAVDNWVMLGFSAALFPMMWRSRRIARGSALILLAGFVAFMSYLVVGALR